MKVLITGSQGYIATNLKQFLKEVSWIGIDKKNGDLAEEFDDFSSVDCVIHLAATSGIQACFNAPKQAAMDNISASFHIFNEAARQGIPVLFASSQAAKNPMDNFYAFTKFAAEQEAQRLNDKGANIRVFRLSNIYGGLAFHKKSTVIAEFVRKKEQRLGLVVNDTGEQRRDFVHVKDVCRAIVSVLHLRICPPTPIDIGSGKTYSINEVAEMFGTSCGHQYNGKAGADSVGVDLNLAKRYLNFSPQESLEEFIRGVGV